MVARGELGAELRVLRGLSVIEAARRAGVSRVSLHRWEAGENSPGAEALVRLLDGLGAEARERARLVGANDPRHAQPALRDGPLGPLAHPGLVLRSLREARGLTQSDLARRVGVGQPSVAKWEAGLAMPGEETLARATAALGAEELDLGEGSLDLYDPIVDPHDARLRIQDLRFLCNMPLTVPRLLAIERELWPLAARDARWEEALADVLARRSLALQNLGEHTVALNVAGRAMRIAESNGCWDAVYLAALAVSSIRSYRGFPAERQARFWRKYAERVRNPLVLSFALNQAVLYGSLSGDFACQARLFPRVKELFYQATPDEIYCLTHRHGAMAESDLPIWEALFAINRGDLDEAWRIYDDRLSQDWERKLAEPTGDRFDCAYFWLHVDSGTPMPEAALRIFNAPDRAATRRGERTMCNSFGRTLGTYTPRVSAPR